MKTHTLVVLVASVHGDHFGPSNCVSVSRSSRGTCVLQLDCDNSDISNFEFSFDCLLPSGEVQEHSFGEGGFDVQEEYDTEVTCNMCAAPGRMPKASQEEAQARSHRSAAAAHASTQGGVVRYGPENCVSTWMSDRHHCMLGTQCQGVDTEDYDFGLVCVDSFGTPVRHMFGKGAFDAEESFDTLVQCRQCLGLTDVPESVTLNSEVLDLAKNVQQLGGAMKSITNTLRTLDKEVFPPSTPPKLSLKKKKKKKKVSSNQTVQLHAQKQAVKGKPPGRHLRAQGYSQPLPSQLQEVSLQAQHQEAQKTSKVGQVKAGRVQEVLQGRDVSSVYMQSEHIPADVADDALDDATDDVVGAGFED